MNAWLLWLNHLCAITEKLTRGHHCAGVVSAGVVIKRVGERKGNQSTRRFVSRHAADSDLLVIL
jgi:hypothetical protein